MSVLLDDALVQLLRIIHNVKNMCMYIYDTFNAHII
jgi:hypothetical protein